MKLTGKCKEDFEKWYLNWVRNLRNDYHRFTNDVLFRKFDREVDAMKWGVYVDFFDSKGIYPEVDVFDLPGMPVKYGASIVPNIIVLPVEFNTATEARTAAIEKANDIYNNQ